MAKKRFTPDEASMSRALHMAIIRRRRQRAKMAAAAGKVAEGAGGGFPVVSTPDTLESLILADSPLGYWKLDETSGTSAADSSGNGFTGTIVGGPTLGEPSLNPNDSGTSIRFFTTTPGDRIGFGTDTTFDFERTDTFSVECLFESTNPTAQTYALVARQETIAPGRGWMVFMLATGEISFALTNTSGATNNLRVTTNNTFKDGVNHHLIVTYDGSSTPGGVHIWVDGVDEALTTNFNTLTATTLRPTNPLQIAARGATGTPATDLAYAGHLDEVAIYGTELSAATVAAHYAVAS